MTFPCITSGYFNPRSREGSDDRTGSRCHFIRISIHAPARGATASVPPTCVGLQISIHAPARGATGSESGKQSNDSNFNPRSREGSDRESDGGSDRVHHISIHAPARGATREGEQQVKPDSDFNPRSREGSDETVATLVRDTYEFQSTLPRGERPASNNASSGISGFQSTLPRGERLRGVLRGCFPSAISIHAPARGATMMARLMVSLLLYFNPRSREGSDANWESTRDTLKTFQSTLPRGERQITNPYSVSCPVISIHAPARGATVTFRPSVSTTVNFNPRSREGSDTTHTARSIPPADFNPRSREGSDRNPCAC